VDWYFTSRIGRAELLNRLGDNIVAFDLLRPEFVDGIASKFLKSLAEAAEEKYKFKLVLDESVLRETHQAMTTGDNLLFGGRRIKSLLETLVERPLNRWLFQNYPETSVLSGKTLTLSLTEASSTLEVTVK
jgi:ATP-dependent Clp protease ATP-binding subunit ClpA